MPTVTLGLLTRRTNVAMPTSQITANQWRRQKVWLGASPYSPSPLFPFSATSAPPSPPLPSP